MFSVPDSDKIKEFVTLSQEKYNVFMARISELPLTRTLSLHKPASLSLLLWPSLWGAFVGSGASTVQVILLACLALLLKSAGNLYEVIMPSSPQAGLYEDKAHSTLVLAVLVAIILMLAHTMSPLTLFWVILWMIGVAVYPYLKRITWMPQLYAGFIYGILPILIGHSIVDSMHFAVIPATLAGFVWATSGETLSAESETDEDMELGIKSLAIYLGDQSFNFLTCCFVAGLVLLILTGLAAGAGGLYYTSLIISQSILYHFWQKGEEDTDKMCINTLQASTVIGFIITLGFISI